MSADRARARFERRLRRLLFKEARRLYFEDLKVTLVKLEAEARSHSEKVRCLAEKSRSVARELESIRASVARLSA